METKPKKSLGQNFLKDKNIIKSIVNLGNINKNNTVFEIGPGTGNLTEFILKKKPKNFFVIEKDNYLAGELSKKYKNNIYIINKDILEFNLKKFSKDKIIIYGNLPYNISTQVLAKLIINDENFYSYKKLIFMFQKEVAERILAKTNSKNYSRLSIISNWRLSVKKEFNINRQCFYPSPKVDSTLLSFVPKKDFFYLKNPKNLEKITRIFFNQKRKMIKSPLRKVFKNYKKIAEKFDLNLNFRPQNLSPNIYFNLAKEFEELSD